MFYHVRFDTLIFSPYTENSNILEGMFDTNISHDAVCRPKHTLPTLYPVSISTNLHLQLRLIVCIKPGRTLKSVPSSLKFLLIIGQQHLTTLESNISANLT